AASELIAHGRTERQIERELGADRLIFQDLEDLIEAAQKKGKSLVDRFDTSVFDGVYITGDVTPDYLNDLERARNDHAKQQNSRCDETVLELYNTA
ncbi:MAG: amidophosphoribosyltransferase, partial [Thiohalocapsa sp.]|nr:amidophosphoribosyltransferase [Thiohalocapsa sp.]